jgi:thiol:disulfide interchange protein DsbD
VIFIKVDLTKEDAEKQQFLEALGSNSIPVVAIFPKGEKAHSPVVLRDIFTSGQMEDALREAFK